MSLPHMQVRGRQYLPLMVGLTWSTACGPVQVLDGHESQALTQLRSGQYELILASELATLRRDAELGRSTGRYQVRSVGYRTWRLDTATGTICLLLTSDADWKRPDSQQAACVGH
jgi:hypothetical protein